VLLLVSLKYGEQSLQWHAALRTMDELIWSVSLQQDTEAGRHLLEQLPGLLKALREGLTGSPSTRSVPVNSLSNCRPCICRHPKASMG
jgi:hypothetical protein